MYRAIQPSRLYEQIVAQIEESVLNGSLKPGDQLPPERELAERFRVSRTAVREAIKALAEKGLVEAHHGRGTFITGARSHTGRVRDSLELFARSGNGDSFPHLTEMREMLEPEIAARAAQQADEKQIAVMREAVAAMDSALGDPDAYIEGDLDFHLAMAEAAENPLVLAVIDSIVGLLREQRARIFRVPGGPERGQSHHKQILAAIERRDPDAARDAMRAHLRQVRSDTEKGTT